MPTLDGSDNATVTTTVTGDKDNMIMSGLSNQLSGEDSEREDKDFAAENLPRPPLVGILYNGQGTFNDLPSNGA